MELVIEIEFTNGTSKALNLSSACIEDVCKLLGIHFWSSFGIRYGDKTHFPFEADEVVELRLSHTVDRHQTAYTLVQILEGHAKLVASSLGLEYSFDFSLDDD